VLTELSQKRAVQWQRGEGRLLSMAKQSYFGSSLSTKERNDLLRKDSWLQ